MKFRILLAAVFALAAFSGSANAMIINGGFESGALAPWFQDRVFSDGEDWNVTNADARSGAFSATNTGNKEIRQNFAGVATDDITEMSFWAKHIGAGAAMFVSLFYSDNTDTGFIVNVDEAAGWLFLDVTANLEAGKMLTGFGIFGNSSGCDGQGNGCTRTFLDDVVLRANAVDTPEPASLALLGLGLAAMGARRRIR